MAATLARASTISSPHLANRNDLLPVAPPVAYVQCGPTHCGDRPGSSAHRVRSWCDVQPLLVHALPCPQSGCAAFRGLARARCSDLCRRFDA
eukprot:2497790-Pleurochrysis_carterae.AAC.1